MVLQNIIIITTAQFTHVGWQVTLCDPIQQAGDAP